MAEVAFRTEPKALRAQGVPAASLPPVIALGEGMTLAEVVTLLAQNRIPHYVVSPEDDFVRYSRWYRELPYKEDVLSPTNLASELGQLEIEAAVLLPCSDDWVSAVAALPASIKTKFPSSTPGSEVIQTLVDKWRFAQALQRENIPHPRTRLLSSHDELTSVPRSEFQGAILKPLFSSAFTAKYRIKGYLLKDREEAVAILADHEFPMMLQEFVAGPPTSAYFLDGFMDRNGNVCGMLARRRLRMFPANLGNTTMSITILRSELRAAEEPLRRLLTAIQYRGIFSAEFKYDERDGMLKLLEINARPWWYVEFAARCGLDVCAMAYQDALGLPVEPVKDYVVGRRCVYYVNDFRAWWAQRRGGDSLWRWIQLWFGAMETPFRWNDPGPALAFPFSMLHKRTRRRASKGK